jgi:signal transduction histidine kinase
MPLVTGTGLAMNPEADAPPYRLEREFEAGAADKEIRQLKAEVAALRQALAARSGGDHGVSTREAALEKAILALPVGVAVFDDQDRLVIKNNRYQLFDQTGERDRPGTSFEDILKFGIELGLYSDAKKDPDGWIEERLRQRRAPGKASVQELQDGRFIQIEERRLEDNSLVSAYTEVTQLKQTEAALSQALERSEAAGRSKTQFLAKMSHELRTPLNAIIGFCQMLIEDREGRIPEDRRRGYLDDIQFAAGHLHDLISDILELVRIESGQEKLDRRMVDIVDLCGRVIQMFEPDAKTNGVALQFELSGSAPEHDKVRLMDGRLVTQMLINVLSNSMRYVSEAGYVRITLGLAKGETVIAVTDNGAGISEDDLAVVLEPFQQGSIKPVRGAGGVGLGLSLTKGMAELHGGTIEIESTVGAGTTVTLRFPDEGPAMAEAARA